MCLCRTIAALTDRNDKLICNFCINNAIKSTCCWHPFMSTGPESPLRQSEYLIIYVNNIAMNIYIDWLNFLIQPVDNQCNTYIMA